MMMIVTFFRKGGGNFYTYQFWSHIAMCYIHIKNRAWSPPSLLPFPPSRLFYISKIQDGHKKKNSVQGVGGAAAWGGIGGAPYIYIYIYIYIFFFFYSMHGVGGVAVGGYRGGGAPIKKNWGSLFFYSARSFEGGGIRRSRRAFQVAEGHQPSAGARSRRP